VATEIALRACMMLCWKQFLFFFFFFFFSIHRSGSEKEKTSSKRVTLRGGCTAIRDTARNRDLSCPLPSQIQQLSYTCTVDNVICNPYLRYH
jgi:hypothetical protein